MKKFVVTLNNPNGQLVDLTADEINEINLRQNKYVTPATLSEFDIAIRDLRTKRNKLLSETDWMANSDITMSDDWKTYRQALRDLTNGLDTVEKVEAVEFPTKPSGE